jgi:hypothetical protein
MLNHVIHVKSCHSCQIMSSMSNYVLCHSCHESIVLFLQAFNKVGSGSGGGSLAQICLPRPLATAFLQAEGKNRFDYLNYTRSDKVASCLGSRVFIRSITIYFKKFVFDQSKINWSYSSPF